MITHVVLFSWVEGTTAAEVGAVAAALDALGAELGVPMRHGPDLGFRETNADYGLIATFADCAAWADYQHDARHQAFVAEFIVPRQASRLSLQFGDGAGA